MEKVASITKYKDKEQIVRWITKLPKKYSLDTIKNFLLIIRFGKYVLWTEKHGLKIL